MVLLRKYKKVPKKKKSVGAKSHLECKATTLTEESVILKAGPCLATCIPSHDANKQLDIELTEEQGFSVRTRTWALEQRIQIAPSACSTDSPCELVQFRTLSFFSVCEIEVIMFPE